MPLGAGSLSDNFYERMQMLVLLTVITLVTAGPIPPKPPHNQEAIGTLHRAQIEVRHDGKIVARSDNGRLKVRLPAGRYRILSERLCIQKSVRLEVKHPIHVRLLCQGR
jgi:hypothetical protein